MPLAKMIVVFLVYSLLTGCAAFGVGLEPPKIRLTSVSLLPAEGLSQRFRIGLLIMNPNANSISVRGLSYSLALNGIELADGVSATVGTLPPYTETPVELDASTNLVAALRFVNRFVTADEVKPIDYNFKAKVDLEGFARRLVIQENGEIPVRLE